MPLPKVSSGESEQDYVSRCMEAQSGESKPKDQKLAICYSTYREAKKGDELRGTVEKAALSAGVSSSIAKEIAGQAAHNYFVGRRRVIIKALKNGVNSLKNG